MVKKIIKITLITLGIGIFLFLVYLNYTSFIDTTKRLADILDIHNLKNFIEKYNSKRSFIYDESIKEIEDAIGGVIDNITDVAQKFFLELLGDTLLNLLDFTSNLLIYFCNYGLNIIILAYIFFHETITGTQISLKTSPPARLYLLIIKSIDKLKELIKKGLKRLKNYIYQERRKLALIIILYLLSNGILYKILVIPFYEKLVNDIGIYDYYLQKENAEDYIYKIDNFKEFLQDLDNTNPKSSIIYTINNIMLDNIKEENTQIMISIYQVNLNIKMLGISKLSKKKKLNINIKEYIMRFHLYAYCQFASFF